MLVMANVINIKKGLDIPLDGKVSGLVEEDRKTDLFAVIPGDFPGYTWKIAVKAGDNVKAGAPLLYAKECEEIKLTAPVAGTVAEIKRGERRRIEYVSVKKGDFSACDFSDSSLPLLSKLRLSGLFAMMRQRPFDIVPDFNTPPRDIFVTAFDSAPLAPSLVGESTTQYLETGLAALASLTAGKVYLSVPYGSGITSSVAEIYEFKGPHPAGNTGVQIASINPVNKGETVWTLDAVTASRIGCLVKTGRADFSADVALTGPDIKDPVIIRTHTGARLETLISGHLKDRPGKIRIISGNVLTGIKESVSEGFLHYPYRQITAIDEGNDRDEFMGWASMSPDKFSVKRTFPAFLRGLSRPFPFDARIKGGRRAMIMSGEYDKVFPFDIYPEYLVKAILAKNIEKMEERGIYEVAPEDFALPEFVDTSKLELQKIVREGLDYLRRETL